MKEKNQIVSRYLQSIIDNHGFLRRYLDFTKFVSLLETSSLFFPTAALLPDLSEGLTYAKRELINMRSLAEIIGHLPATDKSKAEIEHRAQEYRKRFIGISSWYGGDVESFAMWKTYCSSEGVCILTDKNMLTDSIKRSDVIIEQVQYSAKPQITPEYLSPFFKKHKAYAYEHEIRAVINLFEKYGEDESNWKGEEFDEIILNKGILIKVDLGILIKKIVISPLSKPWFKELVGDVSKRYGIKAPVVKSDLHGQISL